MKTCIRSLSFIWIIATLLFAVAPTSHAAGIGIAPKPLANEPDRSWFVYTLNPGSTITDTVVINNHSAKPVTVALEALDAMNTTGGGFTLVKDISANHDLGTWVKLDSNTVRIAPMSSNEVNFTLAVPSDANVGQHSGAISIYEQTGATPGEVGLRVRMGARMYVTIPGKINRKITIAKAWHETENGKPVFHIQAKNDSNINLEPDLDINLRGIFRNTLQVATDNGTYLPGSPINLTIPWEKSPPRLGYFRAKLVFHTWSVDETATDGTTKTLPDQTFVYQYSFWVGGQLLLILFLVLILLWLGYRTVVYLLDQKRYRTKIKPYVVKPNETIMHIAEATNIFPQTITKFNRLAWPYTLNAGDKLLLPIGWLTADELSQKADTEPMSSFWQYLISWRLSLYHSAIPFTPSRAASGAKRPSRRGRSLKSSRQHDSKR